MQCLTLSQKTLTNNKNSKHESGTERTGECFSLSRGQCLTFANGDVDHNESKREKGIERTGECFSLSGGQLALPLKTLTTTTSNNNSSNQERRTMQKGQVTISPCHMSSVF